MEINLLLEANLDSLRKVYAKYFEPMKRYMTMQDSFKLFIFET